jgi:hypothetical protein
MHLHAHSHKLVVANTCHADNVRSSNQQRHAMATQKRPLTGLLSKPICLGEAKPRGLGALFAQPPDMNDLKAYVVSETEARFLELDRFFNLRSDSPDIWEQRGKALLAYQFDFRLLNVGPRLFADTCGAKLDSASVTFARRYRNERDMKGGGGSLKPKPSARHMCRQKSCARRISGSRWSFAARPQ